MHIRTPMKFLWQVSPSFFCPVEFVMMQTIPGFLNGHIAVYKDYLPD